MDEALEIEHTANETKVAALNAAINVAENEKREFKRGRSQAQHADFESETASTATRRG